MGNSEKQIIDEIYKELNLQLMKFPKLIAKECIQIIERILEYKKNILNENILSVEIQEDIKTLMMQLNSKLIELNKHLDKIV